MGPPGRIAYLAEESVKPLYLLGEQDRIRRAGAIRVRI